MTKHSAAVLHPVAFGARRCCRNEVRLHSYLGEGFSSDWAMKNAVGQASQNSMMISSHLIGCQKRKGVIIFWVIQSQPSQSCTQDHLLPHQRTPLQQCPRSAFSLGSSYRALTNSSLLYTVLAPMMLANGNLSELCCNNQCPCTLHVFRMAVSLSNLHHSSC